MGNHDPIWLTDIFFQNDLGENHQRPTGTLPKTNTDNKKSPLLKRISFSRSQISGSSQFVFGSVIYTPQKPKLSPEKKSEWWFQTFLIFITILGKIPNLINILQTSSGRKCGGTAVSFSRGMFFSIAGHLTAHAGKYPPATYIYLPCLGKAVYVRAWKVWATRRCGETSEITLKELEISETTICLCRKKDKTLREKQPMRFSWYLFFLVIVYFVPL